MPVASGMIRTHRRALVTVASLSALIGLLIETTFAQQFPPPTPPEHPCGPCIIYGVPAGVVVPGGIYQINVCTGNVQFVQALAGAFMLAADDSTHLFVSNLVNTLFRDDLTNVAAPPIFGVTSANSTGMGEGGPASLFDGDPAGQLFSLLPQPPALRGVGTIAGQPVFYGSPDLSVKGWA